MTRGEKARELHAKRMNCCQSVFLAFGDITGVDEQAAMNITAGFGGGMQTGEACGAVVGALLALGSAHPFDREDPEGENGKAVAAEMAVAFQEAFEKSFKHCRCEDLLKACHMPQDCEKAAAILQNDGEGYCDLLIESAAEIATKLIAERWPEISQGMTM